ncbi:MAG TPA: nuclear transport factor 2 family protein [Candidatus Binatia bacterium]|jgi:3-phenylpropionate/cinnamic acid dioxygenase small subunit|nr:nuclear transport factor 2 family protein [Candidatus Binatia bacterium]
MALEELAREKEAIAELIARYNYAIDHNDFRGWADCFAPEGIFDGMVGRYAAHRELDRFTADVKKLTATTPNLRHYVTNIQTEVNGNEARSRCFLLMTSTSKESGTKVVIAGEYEDKLVKRDGRWLFTERKVLMDGA